MRYSYTLKSISKNGLPDQRVRVISDDEALVEFLLSHPIEGCAKKVYFTGYNGIFSEENHVVINCTTLEVSMENIDFIECFFSEIMNNSLLRDVKRQLLINNTLK